MRRRSATVARDVLENMDLQCTHCGVIMSGYQMEASGVRYFRCGSCHRWVSSTYSEILGADAKVRTQPKRDPEAAGPRFEDVKSRLERWLAALEDQDPYRLLGVSPGDPPERIRARYYELAMSAHPDRGGSADRMRELNVAYERITLHRARRAAEQLSSGAEAATAELLPGTRQ